jgi:fructose-bisphosphate aldolase class I
MGNDIDAPTLTDTANALVSGDRGLLAMDESTPTCNRRFARLGIAQTPEMRRAWRDLIVTTPHLGDCISGAILYDETIRQQTFAGTPFAQALAAAGIVPVIKVDAGAKPLAGHPGEQVTEGLDGLRERLKEYVAMGARFAKWRAVIAIGPELPSRACVEGERATRSGATRRLPGGRARAIVEPEVLMDGHHTLELRRRDRGGAARRLRSVACAARAASRACCSSRTWSLPGADSADQESTRTLADASVACFLRGVPAAVPGIARSLRRPVASSPRRASTR